MGIILTMMGWMAGLTGVTGVLAILFLILFSSIGGIFGPLNDLFIGLTALFSALLAAMFFMQAQAYSLPLGWAALLAALAGSGVAVSGSVLVLSGRRGWYLSGLYMAAGYGLIGLWLVLASWQGGIWPSGLAEALGRVTGGFMLLGLMTVPGILKGIDAWKAAPWYVNYIGLAGGIGWLVLYPAWCLWMGWLLLS